MKTFLFALAFLAAAFLYVAGPLRPVVKAVLEFLGLP